MVKTKLGYTFKFPNHKCTKKQTSLILDLFEKKHGKIENKQSFENEIKLMTVLEASSLIEHLLLG